MIQTKRLAFTFLFTGFVLFLFYGCDRKDVLPPIFKVENATRTGLHFSNHLTPTPDFNPLSYLYYYNGAGVGAGDFNNDGKIDFEMNYGDFSKMEQD